MLTSCQSSPLAIARHAIQSILRAALNSPDHNCIGLIGSLHPDTIDHALLTGNLQNDRIAAACDHWHKAGITPCGTFSVAANANAPDRQQIEQLNRMLMQHCSTAADCCTVHLLVSLNIEGCLETQAFGLDNGHVAAIPLMLLEDGQTGRKS